MTERRYFNVDPDRRSKFWIFNGTAFQILELELNGGPKGSTILDPIRPTIPPKKQEKSCLFHKKCPTKTVKQKTAFFFCLPRENIFAFLALTRTGTGTGTALLFVERIEDRIGRKKWNWNWIGSTQKGGSVHALSIHTYLLIINYTNSIRSGIQSK